VAFATSKGSVALKRRRAAPSTSASMRAHFSTPNLRRARGGEWVRHRIEALHRAARQGRRARLTCGSTGAPPSW
jgi:hypothetical protein